MGWEYLQKMMEATHVGKRRLVGERLRMDGKDIFNQTIPMQTKSPQKHHKKTNKILDSPKGTIRAKQGFHIILRKDVFQCENIK